MSKLFLRTFVIASALLLAENLHGNNITVVNVRLTGQNTSAGINHVNNYSLVQFDMSWENSWRTTSAPGNWDAAWVFVKYRIKVANGGDGLWKHAWLNNSGHSGGTGTGTTIDAGLQNPDSAFNATTNPALGVFIYRLADGTGTFSVTGIKLRWDYGSNSVADDAVVDVQVFAIEMVYVPQGAFAAGSGGSEYFCFTLTTINTGNATTAPTGTGGFNGSAQGGYPAGQTVPDNASWPNGYNAFYMQKYEITQQQYVDFLNTLTYNQQNARIDWNPDADAGFFLSLPLFRNMIKIHTSGVASTTPAIYETEHPYVACNYLSWEDGAAYSDWAGLRPMTELEFEKACRGTVAPVANEYAWGTATVAGSRYTLNNSGQNNEGIATNYSITAGNASYRKTNRSKGPLRVGIFASHASNTGRITEGASYYGIMELSGNLWERPVTVGCEAGRSYTGLHGNGTLDASGSADVGYWPGINGNSRPSTANTTYRGTMGVTQAAGSGFRGGHWDSNAPELRTSARYMAVSPGVGRDGTYGFRGVRDVP